MDCGKFVGWAKKPENEARNTATAKLIDQLARTDVPLSDWERGFVESVKKFQPKLSPKQREKLDALAKKFHL